MDGLFERSTWNLRELSPLCTHEINQAITHLPAAAGLPTRSGLVPLRVHRPLARNIGHTGRPFLRYY